MIVITLPEYIFIFVLIFLAGWMDAIAGGGGLISLPAYLFVGLPPHLALGTNKFSSFCGTFVSTTRYFRHGMIEIRIAFSTAAAALLGSWLGTRTVLLIKPDFVNYILIILIPVITIITVFSPKAGKLDNSSDIPLLRKYLLSILTGLIVGFYDGFFGPGTGTFLIIFYTALLHYDYTTANGNTKVVNLASNLAAVLTFGWSGNILYKIAIPAAACGILGNLIGSRQVVLKGNKIIRDIMLLVMFLMMIRIIWNVITH